MQRSSSNPGNTSIFSTALQHSHELFTPRRIGLTTAGAFVFVGAAMALRPAVSSAPALESPAYQVQKAVSPEPTPQASTTNQTSSSSTVNTSVNNTSSGSTHSVTVTVNGQNVPVPEGSSQQTVSNADGSTTNIQTSQGTSQNSSSFSLNVHTESSSGGSNTSQ